MKTLVTFSGGLDSTYVLWKLLTETSDEVSAIFVDTSNMEEGWPIRYDLRSFYGSSDAAPATNIANWLSSNVRPFNFVLHNFDPQFCVRGFGNVNSPQTYITRYAVSKINTGEADRLVCTSEKENDGWSNGGTIEFRRPGSMAAYDLFVDLATRGSIEFPLMGSNYTQAVALSELPSMLLSLSDACTLEDSSFKCRKKRWLQNLLDQGKTTQEIYNQWYQSCTVYPGRWLSMKYWLDSPLPPEDATWDMPVWPSSHFK